MRWKTLQLDLKIQSSNNKAQTSSGSPILLEQGKSVLLLRALGKSPLKGPYIVANAKDSGQNKVVRPLPLYALGWTLT